MPDVIDLRDQQSGGAGQMGEQIASLFQALAMRLDPDSALRRLIFPASYGERVAREVVKQAPPEQAAQALTQGTRRAVADESAMSLQERAQVGASEVRARGATSEVTIENAKRELATRRALNEILTPQQSAEFLALQERAGGATAEATMRQRQREADTLRLAEEMGFDAQDDAEMAALQHAVTMQRLNIEATGNEFTEMGQRNFLKLYKNASPRERNIITTGLMGEQGALFGQYLLGEAAFDREKSLIRLRAKFENAKSPAEILQAQFEYKAAIRQERDRIIDRIRESDETERPALIEDMNDLANDMLRADPTTFAMTASGIEKVFGDNIKRVEFDITDVITTQSDAIDQNARMLALSADEAAYNTAVAQLQRRLTDPSTGVLNAKVFLTTLQLAEGYRNERNQLSAEDSSQKAAEEAWLAFMENPAAVNEARRAPRSPTMEEELAQALAGDEATPAQLADMVRRVQRMKSFEYYMAQPDAAPPRPTPPPAAQRSRARQQQGQGGR